jgi:hypothetical protein
LNALGIEGIGPRKLVPSRARPIPPLRQTLSAVCFHVSPGAPVTHRAGVSASLPGQHC